MKESFKERVKRDLQISMEADTTDEITQLVNINQSLKFLYMLENPEVSSVIDKYFEKQTKLQKEIDELNEQADKKWHEIIDNASKIYTSLIKDL
jgi:hypothetical protein